MVYRGVVRRGVIRLAERADLPEGAEVSVRLLRRRAPATSKSATGERSARTGWGARLLEFAGSVEGLPSDLSTNLDHYLYGVSKQETIAKRARPKKRGGRGRG